MVGDAIDCDASWGYKVTPLYAGNPFPATILSDSIIREVAAKTLVAKMDTEVGAAEPYAWVDGYLDFARQLELLLHRR